MALFDYLQGVDIDEDMGEEAFVDHTVYTVVQVRRETASRAQSGDLTPLSGVFFAFLNRLDLDGPGARMVASRCAHCNSRLRSGEPLLCTNGTCPVAMGEAEPQCVEELDIPVMWTDHTGSLERSRISGRVAEGLLGVEVKQFKELSENELTSLKWQFLLERFKVQFKVDIADLNTTLRLFLVLTEIVLNTRELFQVNFAPGPSSGDPVVRVVGVSRARPQEFLEKVFNVRA
ncbi:hypothetical protein HPB51_009977 [Rhipicephalus microplus]|uniref:Uncharacterized protein n=1 Tax=Rhipicephalus microplus TaxID=6941 RepID=A0A9J6EST0_RHIMP|nr:hypothetical protein HPB51_009977 [Rhipicephalus microplus]